MWSKVNSEKWGQRFMCVLRSKEKFNERTCFPPMAFKSKPNKHFVTTINGLSQEYIKTVVPACSECNSNILAALENQIKSSF